MVDISYLEEIESFTHLLIFYLINLFIRGQAPDSEGGGRDLDKIFQGGGFFWLFVGGDRFFDLEGGDIL